MNLLRSREHSAIAPHITNQAVVLRSTVISLIHRYNLYCFSNPLNLACPVLSIGRRIGYPLNQTLLMQVHTGNLMRDSPRRWAKFKRILVAMFAEISVYASDRRGRSARC